MINIHLFNEIVYKKYANLTVSNNAEIEDCVDLIIDRLNQ